METYRKIYIQKRLKKKSKTFPKRPPNPSKMAGVLVWKTISNTNKAPRELPRRFLSSTWPQNGSNILPQGLQNSTKIIRSEFFAGGLSKNAKFFKIVGAPPSISSSRPSQKLLSRPNVLRSSREHAADGPRAWRSWKVTNQVNISKVKFLPEKKIAQNKAARGS